MAGVTEMLLAWLQSQLLPLPAHAPPVQRVSNCHRKPPEAASYA